MPRDGNVGALEPARQHSVPFPYVRSAFEFLSKGPAWLTLGSLRRSKRKLARLWSRWAAQNL